MTRRNWFLVGAALAVFFIGVGIVSTTKYLFFGEEAPVRRGALFAGRDFCNKFPDHPKCQPPSPAPTPVPTPEPPPATTAPLPAPTPTPIPPPSTVAIPANAVLRIGGNPTWSTASLPKYASVVLGAAHYGLIPAIKAASPGTLVTGYKSGMDMADDCLTYYDTCLSGISYQVAVAHDVANPGDPWVLKNSSGVSITSKGYPNSHLANVGSLSYQKQWVTNVVSAFKKFGFNGVHIDNLLGQLSGWSGGVFPPQYPNDLAWENAQRSFISYVGPALKAQGLYVLANTFKGGDNNGELNIAWWKSVAPYVNGLESEYWQQVWRGAVFNNDPCCWTGHWENHLKLAAAAQDAGADFYAGMAGTPLETAKMMYGKASYLLVWDGGGGGFFYQTVDQSDPWNAAYTQNMGTPLAPRYAVGVGWRRDFQRGTVIINPHWSSSQAFSLGGTYKTPTGTSVSSVTLAPTTAMILLK